MRLITWILNILFPRCCLGCKKRLPTSDSPALCTSCSPALLIQRSFACPICRGRIPEPIAGGLPALRTLCHPRSEYIIRWLGWYSDPLLRTLIRGLKFQHTAGIARVFGLSLGASLRAAHLPIDLVVPIPLPRSRYWSRGYNQAALIAQVTAQEIGVVCSPNVLARARATAAQTKQMSWHDRRLNMQDAFVAGKAVRGKTILLVDDVWTSGATLTAAAGALKKAGAGRILAGVIARAH